MKLTYIRIFYYIHHVCKTHNVQKTHILLIKIQFMGVIKQKINKLSNDDILNFSKKHCLLLVTSSLVMRSCIVNCCIHFKLYCLHEAGAVRSVYH